MKNTLFILGLIILLCSGCKYFKKSSKSVETISADTSAVATTTDTSAAVYNDAQIPETNDYSQAGLVTSAVNGTYYMIVGCFTVSSNADRYAENLKAKGYDTQIIPGNNNFRMVAAHSYNSYRESVAELDKFRNEVTPNAWVYLQR